MNNIHRLNERKKKRKRVEETERDRGEKETETEERHRVRKREKEKDIEFKRHSEENMSLIVTIHQTRSVSIIIFCVFP